MKINVVLVPNKQNGYTVYVPALLGCVSEGGTKEEALKNIKAAIEQYLEPVENEAADYHHDAIIEKVAI